MTVRQWDGTLQTEFADFLSELIGNLPKTASKTLISVHLAAVELGVGSLGSKWLQSFDQKLLQKVISKPENFPTVSDLRHFDTLISHFRTFDGIQCILQEMAAALDTRVTVILESKELTFLYAFYALFVHFASTFTVLNHLVDLLSDLKRLTETKRASAPSSQLSTAYQVS